jgi:hypothetical protein
LDDGIARSVEGLGAGSPVVEAAVVHAVTNASAARMSRSGRVTRPDPA